MIAALMALEAASLVVMSALHLGGALRDGSKPFDPSHAGVAEAVIALVLAGGALVLRRGGPYARRAALATLVFAVAGFLVGLSFTVRGGGAVDVTYHVVVLPVLLLTAALLWRRGVGPGPAPRRG